MKRLLLVGYLFACAALAQAEDFRVTLEPRRTGLKPAARAAGDEGAAFALFQTWSGEVKIENIGRLPSGPLQCKYILYVKRQDLGGKLGEDKVEEVTGEFEVSPLKRGGSFSASTSEVKLLQKSVAPGYYIKGGGLTKSNDSVWGVWVKVFSGGSQVAEFMNPLSLKAKFQWN
jgi:hypothetical protein